METEPDKSNSLIMLQIMARSKKLTVTSEQLRHQFGHWETPFNAHDMQRALKHLGLKSRLIKTRVKAIEKIPLPALVSLKKGGFGLLATASEDHVLLQYADQSRAHKLNHDEFEALWDGQLILCNKDHNNKDDNQFGYRWFLHSLWKYRSMMREIMLASLFIQIFALVSPMVFMVVVDKVLTHKSLSTLDVLVFALAIVSLFDVILTALRSYLLSHTNHRIDVELNNRFITHLLNLPVSYFDKHSTGEIIARIRDLESVRQFITGPALTSVLDGLFIGVFLLVMFQFSPYLSAIVLAILPLFFIVSFVFTPFLKKKLEDKFAKDAENQAFLVEMLGNIKTIKGSASQQQVRSQWEEQLVAYIQAAFNSSQYGNTISQTVSFLSKASTVLVLWFGASLVMSGELTVGQLVAFNMLSARVNAPILRISQLWQEFQGMRTSVKRLADILDIPQEPSFNPENTPLPTIIGDIRFDHVYFRYEAEGSVILEDIDLHISPGQIIGLVGASGSGKSTLLQLLRRFYVPDEGSVYIDGIDLIKADTDWLRTQVGVVASTDVLLNKRLIENIAAADPLLSLEDITQAARDAGAHDFIKHLPKGYDTLAGEGGSHLSSGQQQRVLIARALATNPRILVLDEATNFLDQSAQKHFLHSLKKISRNRTVIIATHRLSMLRQCNNVIVLEQGRIVEQGLLADLDKPNSAFRQLFRGAE